MSQRVENLDVAASLLAQQVQVDLKLGVMVAAKIAIASTGTLWRPWLFERTYKEAHLLQAWKLEQPLHMICITTTTTTTTVESFEL
jgi:hypothetical protein